MTRVAILDDYQQVALRLAPWRERLPECELVVLSAPFASADELVRKLEDFDVIVAMRERTPFPAAVLTRLPRLKLLVTTGSCNCAIDVGAALERGIVVSGTRGKSAATVEHTWALILSLARQVPEADAAMRAGGWQTTIGRDLACRTVGLLGLGKIGTRVAAIGAAFGMDVVAWSPNLTPERAAAAGARFVGKAALFEQADIVSIHIVLSGSTRGLVGASELESLGPDGILVNTSRGPIVDQAALLDALEQGIIAGAALDVFDEEPLPAEHPLRRAPRTVLTPHLGYVTERQYRLFYGDAVEDIRAFLDGAPVRTLTAEA